MGKGLNSASTCPEVLGGTSGTLSQVGIRLSLLSTALGAGTLVSFANVKYQQTVEIFVH